MPETNKMTGEEATRLGYCRISNKYRIVARIDDPQWIEKLAKHLHRSVAELYRDDKGNPGALEVSPMWADFYRRTFSKDQLTLKLEEFLKVPGSDWNPTGWVAKLIEETECLDQSLQKKQSSST
jgi:hypothetical protein